MIPYQSDSGVTSGSILPTTAAVTGSRNQRSTQEAPGPAARVKAAKSAGGMVASNKVSSVARAFVEHTTPTQGVVDVDGATRTTREIRPAALVMLLTAQLAWAAADTSYDEVAPILAQHCVVCHSGSSAAAGLGLDSHDAIVKGSARGAVVKSGDAENSELIRRIKGVSQPRMPLTGPPFLSDSEIATIERWVAGGLPQGSSAAPALPPGLPRPAPGEATTYRHVAPIFARRCAKCHSDNSIMGAPPEGYRLTSHADTVSPRDRVRVIPGHPAASELVRRIRGQSLPAMPFDGPPFLDEQEIRLIEDWIAGGARNTDGEKTQVPAGARVRLHGRLEAGGRLDGIQLLIGPSTRIDKNPRPGDYVQVRGRIDPSGNIQVERLRRR